MRHQIVCLPTSKRGPTIGIPIEGDLDQEDRRRLGLLDKKVVWILVQEMDQRTLDRLEEVLFHAQYWEDQEARR